MFKAESSFPSNEQELTSEELKALAKEISYSNPDENTSRLRVVKTFDEGVATLKRLYEQKGVEMTAIFDDLEGGPMADWYSELSGEEKRVFGELLIKLDPNTPHKHAIIQERNTWKSETTKVILDMLYAEKNAAFKGVPPENPVFRTHEDISRGLYSLEQARGQLFVENLLKEPLMKSWLEFVGSKETAELNDLPLYIQRAARVATGQDAIEAISIKGEHAIELETGLIEKEGRPLTQNEIDEVVDTARKYHEAV